MGQFSKKDLHFKKNYVIIRTDVRNKCSFRKHIFYRKELISMEPYTYFIIAVILLLISFGASAPVAASATLAVSVIMFAGGLLTKLVLRR